MSEVDKIEGADDSEPDALTLETRTLVAGAVDHGRRLDVVLARQVPELSRAYLQQLLTAGAVSLKSQIVLKPSMRVTASDVITLEMRPTLQSQAFRAEVFPLEVIYEDAHLLVVNKAAGMVVHPAPGNWSGTMLNALLGRDAQAFAVPRAGIVHRLDKDTSGLMVVARTRACMDSLVKLIAERQVHRQYLAIAHGSWNTAAQCTVEEAIGRDPRNRLRMAVVDLSRQAGKEARTDVRLLQTQKDFCLVECTLHTGRTHQIRVHMAHIGRPLVSDTLYGGASRLGLSRQALHAYRLSFAHPVTGQSLAFCAALPSDFANALHEAGFAQPQVRAGATEPCTTMRSF